MPHVNYSQLTADQQAGLDALVSAIGPAVSALSKILENTLGPTDTQYLATASAILTLLQASEYTLTNLATTSGNTSAPVITSATHNFTSDELNNYINITNWTPGLYKIVSVSANAATLDRACGTAASLTSGTGNVLAMIPQKSGLAGINPSISRDDVVTIMSHIEVCTALNDSNHRQLWIKCCGLVNL